MGVGHGRAKWTSTSDLRVRPHNQAPTHQAVAQVKRKTWRAIVDGVKRRSRHHSGRDKNDRCVKLGRQQEVEQHTHTRKCRLVWPSPSERPKKENSNRTTHEQDTHARTRTHTTSRSRREKKETRGFDEVRDWRRVGSTPSAQQEEGGGGGRACVGLCESECGRTCALQKKKRVLLPSRNRKGWEKVQRKVDLPRLRCVVVSVESISVDR